jgi:Male sterility protein
LRFQGSKIRLFNIYSKVFYQCKLLEYFMSQTWDFEDINMQEIYHSMSKKDHEDFPVVIKSEDYEIHGVRGTEGLRKYFFKENDEDLKVAKRRYAMFAVMHKVLLAIVYGLSIYTLYSLTIK